MGDTLLKAGIENRECAFFNRFGQLIYREDRGKFAGYPFPEVGIHRGRLHVILYEAVLKKLGRDSVLTDRECTGIEQDDAGATVHFKQTTSGQPTELFAPMSSSHATASIRLYESSSIGTTRSLFPESIPGVALRGANRFSAVGPI